MRVVVFGASGGVGSRVVASLAADGHEVVGVVRREDAADAVSAAGATPALADVVGSDLRALLDGTANVVWALGARFMTDGPDAATRIDRDGAARAVAAGAAAGVKRWVHVSSLLADRPQLGPPVLVPFLEAKGASDAALMATEMSWTVIRPSGLSDDAGTGLVLAAPTLTPQSWAGEPIPPRIPRADVAALAVTALTSGLAQGRAFDVVAGSTPIAEALATLP